MSLIGNRGEVINPSTLSAAGYVFPNAGFYKALAAGTMVVEFEDGSTMTQTVVVGEIVNWLRIKKITTVSTVTSAEVYHIGIGK